MSRSFESGRVASRDEAATALRDMADGVSGGVVRLSQDGETIDVESPGQGDLEIELEIEDGEMSVEVELEWPDPSASGGEPVESVDETSEEDAVSTVDPGEGPESLARFEVFLDNAEEWRWRMVHTKRTRSGGERGGRLTEIIWTVIRNPPTAQFG